MKEIGKRNGEPPYLLVIDTPQGKEEFVLYSKSMAQHLQEVFGGTVYRERYEPKTNVDRR